MAYSWEIKEKRRFSEFGAQYSGGARHCNGNQQPSFRPKPDLAPNPSGRLNKPLTITNESLPG